MAGCLKVISWLSFVDPASPQEKGTLYTREKKKDHRIKTKGQWCATLGHKQGVIKKQSKPALKEGRATGTHWMYENVNCNYEWAYQFFLPRGGGGGGASIPFQFISFQCVGGGGVIIDCINLSGGV